MCSHYQGIAAAVVVQKSNSRLSCCDHVVVGIQAPIGFRKLQRRVDKITTHNRVSSTGFQVNRDVAGPVPLPTDIRPGDYLEFGNIGAYRVSGRTDYNGY